MVTDARRGWTQDHRGENERTERRQIDTAPGVGALGPAFEEVNDAIPFSHFRTASPLSYLLADQVEPRKKIAQHPGVSLRTLHRYQASGNAPRAVYLALWFESRWGMAALLRLNLPVSGGHDFFVVEPHSDVKEMFRPCVGRIRASVQLN